MLVFIKARRVGMMQAVGVYDAKSFDAAIRAAYPIGKDYIIRLERVHTRYENSWQLSRQRGARIRQFPAWCSIATEDEVKRYGPPVKVE